MLTRPLGNIVRVIPVDLAAGDYEYSHGFFIRAETAGYLTYWPLLNADNEPITKWFEASYLFIDPELCRKISSSADGYPATSPTCGADNIYVGEGV